MISKLQSQARRSDQSLPTFSQVRRSLCLLIEYTYRLSRTSQWSSQWSSLICSNRIPQAKSRILERRRLEVKTLIHKFKLQAQSSSHRQGRSYLLTKIMCHKCQHDSRGSNRYGCFHPSFPIYSRPPSQLTHKRIGFSALSTWWNFAFGLVATFCPLVAWFLSAHPYYLGIKCTSSLAWPPSTGGMIMWHVA